MTTSGTANDILVTADQALDRTAADLWFSITGTTLEIGPSGQVLVVSSDTQGLLATIGEIYSRGQTAMVVVGVNLDPTIERILVSAGFRALADGLIYRGPEPRTIDRFTEKTLAGPIASRIFAGESRTSTATLADLGATHRTLVQDGTRPAGWLSRFRTSELHSLDPASRVVPLEGSRIPTLVHQQSPGPILLVGDTDPETLGRFRAELRFDELETALLRASGPIDDQVAALRAARTGMLASAQASGGIVAPRTLFRSELDRASVIADAASRGVPVLADHVDSLARYLGTAVVSVLEQTASTDFEDLIFRDELGVRLHRASNADLRSASKHSGQLVWEPAVTAVVATIRPRLVPAAITQLNSQLYPNLEAIIAVHGTIDRATIEEWTSAASVPLRVLTIDQEQTLGHLYNVSADAADGEVFAVMDDDDFYGRNHIVDVVDALTVSQAQIVGKGAEFFHLQGLNLTIQRSPEGRYRYSDFIGGSTLTIRMSTLREIGGFRPITLGVDRATVIRVQELGGRPYRAHGYGYLVGRRVSGHTWDPGDQYFVAASIRQMEGVARVETGLDTETG